MGVVPESVKLLIGVHYNVIPLLLEPALSLLGADHLITFGVDQPAHIAWRTQAAFSDFRGGDTRSYPRLLFHPNGFQYASFCCDLSIAAT